MTLTCAGCGERAITRRTLARAEDETGPRSLMMPACRSCSRLPREKWESAAAEFRRITIAEKRAPR